jgi:hypothetical protein
VLDNPDYRTLDHLWGNREVCRGRLKSGMFDATYVPPDRRST